jgi:hypothetical protein
VQVCQCSFWVTPAPAIRFKLGSQVYRFLQGKASWDAVE